MARPRIAIPRTNNLGDYEEAVRRAGGEPVIIEPATETPEDVVRRHHGVLLAGGGDVLPSLYGEIAHATFSASEPGRDEFELALSRGALDAGLPLFAICRGIQVLNVSRGGTLVQDIPSELPSPLPHRIAEPRFAIAHDISVMQDSLLDRLLPARAGAPCLVNSRHHQAVKQLGAGLAVTALAPDGVIEAIEDPSRPFCLGVQWHPENFWSTGEFRELFEAFVRACRI